MLKIYIFETTILASCPFIQGRSNLPLQPVNIPEVLGYLFYSENTKNPILTKDFIPNKPRGRQTVDYHPPSTIHVPPTSCLQWTFR